MIKHSFLQKKNIVHGFFSSKGGHSLHPYDSLNCSSENGDDLAKVSKNLEIVKNKLNLKKIIIVKQTHSSVVIILNKVNQMNKMYVADGLVTNLKDIGLSILTADCCPILFADYENMIIGACHAGWRGAINNIISLTIKKMKNLGAKTNNIVCAIGPTIQKNSFEIGSDVFKLVKHTYEYKNNHDIILNLNNGKYLFNLPMFVKEKILREGIDKIGDVHLDTYSNVDFFSYRRKTHENSKLKLRSEKIITGRQISIIGLI